ncbi:MAG: hypothetical protein AAGA77_19935 [Bacteroidota bacterium]
MKKVTYKLIFFLVAGTFLPLHASEPTFKEEFTREVHKTFDVSSGANLKVQNKHGDIVIETWDKNQIQIDVLLKVKSNNSEKAQKFLNEIDIDFSSSRSHVSAQTVYPDNNKSWWSNWFGDNNNLDYEVHYTINAPSVISTSIINKYGTITQASIDGDCDVTNKYGDIYLDNISEDLVLNLGYGKAKAGVVGNTIVEMKSSTLKIEEASDIEMTVKHSKIKIERLSHMKLESKYNSFDIGKVNTVSYSGKYDEIEIETIGTIDVEAKYSDLKIGQLNQEGSFDTKKGAVRIVSTGSSLQKIKIAAKYTDYKFNFSEDFHLEFLGSHSNLELKEPYKTYLSDKDGSDLRLKAFRGSKDKGVQIVADMRYGGLIIN